MIKDDKRFKNQSEKIELVDSMEIGAFLSSNGYSSSCLEIDLNSFVDGYDYHDFPSYVSVYWNKDDVKSIISKLNEVLEYMDKLDEANNE